MGQAKQRGTYEERKSLAVERKARDQAVERKSLAVERKARDQDVERKARDQAVFEDRRAMQRLTARKQRTNSKAVRIMCVALAFDPNIGIR